MFKVLETKIIKHTRKKKEDIELHFSNFTTKVNEDSQSGEKCDTRSRPASSKSNDEDSKAGSKESNNSIVQPNRVQYP